MIDLQLHAAFNLTNIDDLKIYGILRYASARQSKKFVFQKFKINIRRGAWNKNVPNKTTNTNHG